MSDPSQREHIHSVFLNATFTVGITKLCAKLECSKSAGVLYALGEGLFKEGCISTEDHDLLAKRYGRSLKQVLEQSQGKRENSHVPVLTLEQQKEKQALEQQDRLFQGILAQWSMHPNVEWRRKAVENAKKYQDKLQSAKDVLALEPRIAEMSQNVPNTGPSETSYGKRTVRW